MGIAADAARQTTVFIAGGGPVGLAMSLLLDRFGIDCVVVEKSPTTTDHPKSRGCPDKIRSCPLVESYPASPDQRIRLRRPIMHAVKDTRHLYEVERRAYYAQGPGFRIAEMQISPTQTIPWHLHNEVQDTFYVVSGTIRIFTRDPEEEVCLFPGQTYSVRAGRPHHVTNAGQSSAVFLVLQGPGEFDSVRLA